MNVLYITHIDFSENLICFPIVVKGFKGCAGRHVVEAGEMLSFSGANLQNQAL